MKLCVTEESHEVALNLNTLDRRFRPQEEGRRAESNDENKAKQGIPLTIFDILPAFYIYLRTKPEPSLTRLSTQFDCLA